jgi:hypothetical protein
LKAHTIDLHARVLDELHNSSGTSRLGTAVFEIVVVVVELDIWIGSCGGSECNGDIGFADGGVEDVGAIGAIFVQGLNQKEIIRLRRRTGTSRASNDSTYPR